MAAAGVPPPDGEKPRSNVFVLAGVGTMNVVCVLAGSALGWLVDSQLATTPIFILVGLVAGISVAVYGTYRVVRSYLKE
jgi:F0F1-type ATP synthase assembly protein I